MDMAFDDVFYFGECVVVADKMKSIIAFLPEGYAKLILSFAVWIEKVKC